MSASRDPYIPPQASCFVKDYSCDEEEIAVCLPSEGLYIYRHGRVIDWCDVGEETVTNIALFFTYEPYSKHYVLQFPSQVKVVSKHQQLHVSYKFEGVVKFKISDFKNKGMPQIGLWKKDLESPQITELSVSSEPPCVNPIETILSSKLQGLKMSVAKLRNQVDEKRRLRRLHSFSFFKSSKGEHCQPYAELVPLIGSNSQEKTCGNSVRIFLEVKESWQRLLCGHWVIGCDIINVGQSGVRGPALCVRLRGRPAPTPLTWRVMLHRGHAWSSLQPGDLLQPGHCASIVGVVPEPSFTHRDPVVELSGVIRFSVSDCRDVPGHVSLVVPVPRWSLSAEAVARGALLPFAGPGGGSHSDLLACLVASSFSAVLQLDGRAGLPPRVLELLRGADLQPLGEAAPAHLLVGRGMKGAPLHGALVTQRTLASTCCQLELHLRESRHVFLLAHLLRAGLPACTRLSVAGAGAGVARDVQQLRRRLLEALLAEVSAVATQSPLPLRNTLAPLELATDLAVRRLRKTLTSVSDCKLRTP